MTNYTALWCYCHIEIVSLLCGYQVIAHIESRFCTGTRYHLSSPNPVSNVVPELGLRVWPLKKQRLWSHFRSESPRIYLEFESWACVPLLVVYAPKLTHVLQYIRPIQIVTVFFIFLVSRNSQTSFINQDWCESWVCFFSSIFNVPKLNDILYNILRTSYNFRTK